MFFSRMRFLAPRKIKKKQILKVQKRGNGVPLAISRGYERRNQRSGVHPSRPPVIV